MVRFLIACYGFFLLPLFYAGFHGFFVLVRRKDLCLKRVPCNRVFRICAHAGLNYVTLLLFACGWFTLLAVIIPFTIVDGLLALESKPFHRHDFIPGLLAFASLWILFVLVRNQKIPHVRMPRQLRRFAGWTNRFF